METEKLGKRGRVSFREQIETFLSRPLLSIFEMYFKGLKTPEDAVKKLAEITKGELKVGSATIIKTLFVCKQENPLLVLDEYPFACIEKKEKGAHFRENSFRAKLEKASGKTLWDILNEFSKLDAEGILDQIQLLYNIEAEKPALLNAIKSALENEEIDQEKFDSYDRLFPTPRKRRTLTTPDGEEVESQSNIKRVELMVHAECTECGNTTKWKTTTATVGATCDIGILGRRCSCGKWGSHKCTTTINGKKIIKMAVNHDDVRAEEFVDSKGNIIENPLLPEDLA